MGKDKDASLGSVVGIVAGRWWSNFHWRHIQLLAKWIEHSLGPTGTTAGDANLANRDQGLEVAHATCGRFSYVHDWELDDMVDAIEAFDDPSGRWIIAPTRLEF